jgi:hypothetical protein
MTDCRSISLFTNFSKILETVMFNTLNQHLKANSTLVSEQLGFRKGIYVQKAIFTLNIYILTALNQRQQIGGNFRDLSKAFHCVNHTELILRKGLKRKLLSPN